MTSCKSEDSPALSHYNACRFRRPSNVLTLYLPQLRDVIYECSLRLGLSHEQAKTSLQFNNLKLYFSFHIRSSCRTRVSNLFINCAKCKKAQKSKILKNNGHFRILHPQISFKQFSNICENVVYFFTVQGVEKCWRIFAKQFNKKNIKIATSTHCMFAL